MVQVNQRRGQGTLEYILVLVVILLAILASTTGIKAAMKDQVYNAAQNQINKAAEKWNNVIK